MIKILIAVDGSALSLDAVHHVLRLVQDGLRASVVLANVQEPASLYELVVSRDPDLIAAASLEAGDHLAQGLGSRHHPGREVRDRVVPRRRELHGQVDGGLQTPAR